MELKQFIKDTVSQIAEAVQDLNSVGSSPALVVNPLSSTSHDNEFYYKGSSRNQTMLNFHIALNDTEKDGTSGKVGVLLGWFAGAAGSNTDKESGAITTLSFKLPVLLPQA